MIKAKWKGVHHPGAGADLSVAFSSIGTRVICYDPALKGANGLGRAPRGDGRWDAQKGKESPSHGVAAGALPWESESGESTLRCDSRVPPAGSDCYNSAFPNNEKIGKLTG